MKKYTVRQLRRVLGLSLISSTFELLTSICNLTCLHSLEEKLVIKLRSTFPERSHSCFIIMLHFHYFSYWGVSHSAPTTQRQTDRKRGRWQSNMERHALSLPEPNFFCAISVNDTATCHAIDTSTGRLQSPSCPGDLAAPPMHERGRSILGCGSWGGGRAVEYQRRRWYLPADNGALLAPRIAIDVPQRSLFNDQRRWRVQKVACCCGVSARTKTITRNLFLEGVFSPVPFLLSFLFCSLPPFPFFSLFPAWKWLLKSS